MNTSPSLHRVPVRSLVAARTLGAAVLTVSAAALLQAPAFATDFIKLPNALPLNNTGSWNGLDDPDGLPDGDDILVWNNTFTTPVNPRTGGALSAIGADLSVLGIRVANVGGTTNQGTTAIGIQNPGSANTLTIGAAGIDMSAATQTLYIESKLALSENQVWTINNANTSGNPTGFNNGEDLSLRAQTGNTTTALTSFDLGGHELSTAGAGAVTVSSGYAITNGTINIGNSLFLIAGGDSRFVTVGSDVTLRVATGSTLHFQSNSAGVASSANIELNGGTLKLVSASSGTQVTIGGTTTVNSASTLLVGNNVGNASSSNPNGILFNSNLAGSASLTVTNSASTATPLIVSGNNSGYAGTITFGGTAGRVTRLTTAASGSAAATWTVSVGHTLEVQGVEVSLGMLNGAGSINASSGTGTISVGAGSFSGTLGNGLGTLGLTKVTTGTLNLTGNNTYTGATNVNEGTLVAAPTALGTGAISVASGANLVVTATAAEILGASSIALADGGNFVVRPLAQGASVAATQLSAGTAAGATVTLDTGTLGNPTGAPLMLDSFNPIAGTTIRVLGINLTPGTFSGIGYASLGGGGFDGLSLSLPFRVAGNLENNLFSIDVKITGIAKPVWTGGVNGNWDIDSTGVGAEGTANWFATAGPDTYVESPSLGNDVVVFDDSATGTREINLTTTLSPGGITVNNSGSPYTFAGSGKLSGGSVVVKSGTGTLTIANTGTNDFTGETTINQGTVQLGDGVIGGAGTLGSGTVAVGASGVLELNRPDDFTFGNVLSGLGRLTKSQENTATVSRAVTFDGGVTINAGTLLFGAAATLNGDIIDNGVLRLNAGGTLGGMIGGTGELHAGGGTVVLSGVSTNTYTGLTTVSAGTLQLNKVGGELAMGGDLLITGTGVLAVLAPEQIPDAATITFTGTSADATAGTTSMETVANVIANPSSPAGQFQMRFGFKVTGTATLNNGVLGVSSGQNATVNEVVMTGGILRIAGNTGNSMLDIGSGGISASGGEIQVKFNTNNWDGVLNLGGDFTATGNVAITNGNYAGANLNVINLTDTRFFDIAPGTTTSIAPDLAGAGGLIKTGGGTLLLTSASAGSYAGLTDVDGGKLLVNGAINGNAIVVNANGTLGGGGTVADVVLNAGGAIDAGTVGDDFAATSLTWNGETVGTFGQMQFELGFANNSSDVLALSGLLNKGTGSSFIFDFLSTGTEFTSYTLLTFSGQTGFATSDFAYTNLAPGMSGVFDLQSNALVFSIVPEPNSAAVLMGGALCLAGLRRRRPRRRA